MRDLRRKLLTSIVLSYTFVRKSVDRLRLYLPATRAGTLDATHVAQQPLSR